MKMNPIGVRSGSCTEYNVDSNAKKAKFEIGDHVKISKYKNNIGKDCTPDKSKNAFVNGKVKNTVPWTYVISDLNNEETDRLVCEKKLQKPNHTEFRVEKNKKKSP